MNQEPISKLAFFVGGAVLLHSLVIGSLSSIFLEGFKIKRNTPLDASTSIKIPDRSAIGGMYFTALFGIIIKGLCQISELKPFAIPAASFFAVGLGSVIYNKNRDSAVEENSR